MLTIPITHIMMEDIQVATIIVKILFEQPGYSVRT